jgi:hypothetical protein
MWHAWRKRALAYGVLVAVLLGAIYLLQNTTVKVDVVVDLMGARKLGEAALTRLEVGYFRGENRVAGTVYTFAPAAFPEGPPVETRPVTLGLVRGDYDVRMQLTYGDGPGARAHARTVVLTVEAEGGVRLRAGP